MAPAACWARRRPNVVADMLLVMQPTEMRLQVRNAATIRSRTAQTTRQTSRPGTRWPSAVDSARKVVKRGVDLVALEQGPGVGVGFVELTLRIRSLGTPFAAS